MSMDPKLSLVLVRVASDIIYDVKVDSVTEDISILAELIQTIIENLKEENSLITENELLTQLRYKGFLINPIVIQTVKDAIKLEEMESILGKEE